jgi:hypothetical protein
MLCTPNRASTTAIVMISLGEDGSNGGAEDGQEDRPQYSPATRPLVEEAANRKGIWKISHVERSRIRRYESS